MSFQYFFQTLKPNAQETAQKIKNLYCKCVLDFNFAPIKGSVFFIFFKKVKFVVPYWTVYVCGGGGQVLHGLQTDTHLPQSPLTGQQFKMTTFCFAFYESYLPTDDTVSCGLVQTVCQADDFKLLSFFVYFHLYYENAHWESVVQEMRAECEKKWGTG